MAAAGVPTFGYSRWLFLRLLGVVYLIAFASFGVQATGLVGAHGILPAGELLAQARSELGGAAYLDFPTLLWLSTSDGFLLFLSWAGAALSILLIIGVAPVAVAFLLWVFYLSVTVAGQTFLEFQWDALLLETGLLACLYAPLDSLALARGRPTVRGSEPNPIVRWVLWGLAFKLTFLSGITKILSADPSWANWTAMTFHYETQPLPAWTSWYAHNAPRLVHYWSVPAMYAIEIVAPFAIVLPPRFRRTRLIAIVAMILLQAGIGATGNYGFFNILTIVLSLALLDDDTLRRLRLRRRPPFTHPIRERASGGKVDERPRAHPRRCPLATSVVAIVIALLSAVTLVREMEYTAGTRLVVDKLPVNTVMNWLAPFRSVNGYGLFRVMTTQRPEILVEVSADGTTWKEYEFRWKAGDPQRRPSFVEPHMPRLDWQMWFAALDPLSAQPWLARLAERILDGEPDVMRLLGPNPLGARPMFVRLVSYDYHFTTPEERAATGAWWKRTFMQYLTGPMRKARQP